MKAKKKLVDLVWTDKKSYQIDDLVEKCEKKTRISSIANYSTLLSKSIFQIPVSTFIPIIYFGVADSWPVNKKIDKLTVILKSLALLFVLYKVELLFLKEILGPLLHWLFPFFLNCLDLHLFKN